MRLSVDKIASSTRNVPLRRDVRISAEIVARPGYLVAGRVRGHKNTYNQLEDPHGRMVTLHDGDVIVGVLGHRNALHGYSGVAPESVAVGDVLQLLNLGGVIGRCTSENPDLGRPFDVEILGGVQVFPDFESREGAPAHIGMNAIAIDHSAGSDADALPDVPVVYIAGTCMSSGKTSAACQLVRQLAQRGAAVGACKCTGVSLRRDTLAMMDHGARWAVSFNDAGVVTSDAASAVPVARGLIAHLAGAGAAVIVSELGDGIMGEYGVQEILADRVLMERSAAIVLCANDPVGAWGARQIMADRFGLAIDVFSGPATDNAVGTRFIRQNLGIEAINARTHGRELGEFVAAKINGRPAGCVQ